MTTSQDSFTPAAMGTTQRPEAPIQVSKLAIADGGRDRRVCVGGLVGSQGFVWGLLIGLVTAGLPLLAEHRADRQRFS